MGKRRADVLRTTKGMRALAGSRAEGPRGPMLSDLAALCTFTQVAFHRLLHSCRCT